MNQTEKNILLSKEFLPLRVKGFSVLSKTNPVLWVASVIPADLKPLMIFSYTFRVCVYNSTIHFACNGVMILNWGAILTSHRDLPRVSWFDTSFVIHVLYFSEIKDLVALLTELSNGWNFFAKLRGAITTSQECFAHTTLSKPCYLDL